MKEIDIILDVNMLKEYCTAISANVLLKSVELFESLVPEYIANIINAFNLNDKEAACNAAHKLKSATSAIGLYRLQIYAQYLQHGEDPKWDKYHQKWFTYIEQNIYNDIAKLKEFLLTL